MTTTTLTTTPKQCNSCGATDEIRTCAQCGQAHRGIECQHDCYRVTTKAGGGYEHEVSNHHAGSGYYHETAQVCASCAWDGQVANAAVRVRSTQSEPHTTTQLLAIVR